MLNILRMLRHMDVVNSDWWHRRCWLSTPFLFCASLKYADDPGFQELEEVMALQLLLNAHFFFLPLLRAYLYKDKRKASYMHTSSVIV